MAEVLIRTGADAVDISKDIRHRQRPHARTCPDGQLQLFVGLKHGLYRLSFFCKHKQILFRHKWYYGLSLHGQRGGADSLPRSKPAPNKVVGIRKQRNSVEKVALTNYSIRRERILSPITTE